MATSMTRGVVMIHSAPRALCPHLEWAVGRALGRAVSFDWADQPVLPGARRAEYFWSGPVGTGAAITSAMHGWEHLRFEVTEDPSAASDGARWMHTPDLGIHHAQTDAAGNVVVGEDRVRYALELAIRDVHDMQRELQVALGSAWDDELEPFRHASDDAPVVWLHKVG
ncbi:MAG: DUF3145 domain-containing protein [Actinobacteria bacterium]|jgi:hypothetical protein|uniref:DUF3145 domain-containing protein n=1 Tax=Microbacterium TaxID=33882 RepID=UPI000C3EBF1B|nr:MULTISPECIES: DUF3145 domain-containing protein [unclassified Microbacterium]MEC8761703.1 DUF3145 domain-containing protein [Actinomycetota bacterium]MBU20060.1 hypothetical protein [Microbacterium sp.]RUA26865.1 MAG: DUF3145 domain-containing protein [Actinomycetota bacterium]HAJ17548.1 DUF3145 domain-containing protein [Microbacterium sp.]HAM13410.1 DUF3145 domain-containing protein [Microbacterium sp.]